MDLLASTLARDAHHAQLPAHLQVDRHLAVTCLDQVGEEVRFIEHGEARSTSPQGFVRRCLRATSSTHALTSHAATRAGCGEIHIPHPWLRPRARATTRGPGRRRAPAALPQ
jgi:hypothetical protein